MNTSAQIIFLPHLLCPILPRLAQETAQHSSGPAGLLGAMDFVHAVKQEQFHSDSFRIET